MEEEKMEVMEVENTTMENEDNVDSEMSNGVSMLIGAGITLAVLAVGKTVKKVWKKHKAKKESAVEVDEVVENAEVVDSSDSDEK